MKSRVEVERIYGKNIATGKKVPTMVCRIRFDGDVVGYYSMRAKTIGYTNPTLLDDEMEEVSREVSLTMDAKVETSTVAPIEKSPPTNNEVEDYGDF